MVVGSRSLLGCIALAAVILAGTCRTSSAAKILAVFPSISKTNYLFGQVLFEALAARGHNVSKNASNTDS